MIKPTKYLVKITQNTTTYNPNSAFDIKTKEVVLEDYRCIENIPNNKNFKIRGQQLNAEADYVLYLEKDDPVIEQESDIEWNMHGYNFSGKVKFIKPYSQIVYRRIAECYIKSDNQ